MGKFVIRNVATGMKFDLRAANGETIASSEVYTTKNACLNGIKSVMKNAQTAEVEDCTKEERIRRKNPKFELIRDNAGEYRFRLKATNGQVIATSEGYAAKASCEKGIESVRKNAIDAEILEAR